MRYSAAYLATLNFVLTFLAANGSPDPRYVCSFCDIVLGLVEQSAFQVHLENALVAKCDADSKICHRAVKELVNSLVAKAVPETICAEVGACTQDCKLFSQWPIDPLPEQPIDWPIERRLSEETTKATSMVKENIMDLNVPRDLKVLKPIFESFMLDLPEEWGMWAHVTAAMGNMFNKHQFNLTSTEYPDDCQDISCKIQRLVDHKPLQDHDGDYYSTLEAKRLRGSDWRGYDCDDKHNNVYPGRHASAYPSEIDHNCNAITGRNASGTYEQLFCANSQPRGIAILGDSATAHFHIPPQWLTAQGWNFNQLLPDALNEIDVPHCSWGTGHVTPEECPYQHEVPGVTGITSLYTQLRARNRCNHNDFQNIGVNGARITSSMQLVDALARDQVNDNPLLVYLALIGNDICNGHPDFTHMTKPDVFYTKAMETLTALDNRLPANSYVVSVALFDGELLYATMHNHVHPVGTQYKQMYDYMNCLEENPCWGWLNTNQTVRRISTVWSDSLNMAYSKIEKEQNFKNFKYIFYSPRWSSIFDEYTQTGRPLTDLIEPADGFHPSQTGNALFAKHFFAYLDENYPDAIGPINPFNAEMDALFFNTAKK